VVNCNMVKRAPLNQSIKLTGDGETDPWIRFRSIKTKFAKLEIGFFSSN